MLERFFNMMIVFCLVSCSAIFSQNAEFLLFENFDKELDSGLAKALISHRHIYWEEHAGIDNSSAIRVEYVGYDRGSERVVVRYPLSKHVEQATLFYKVKFDKAFQWVRGGKLHGLGPERPITGGATRYPHGWSARIMFKSDGKCSTYLYDQDQTKKWGMGQCSAQPAFKAGQWHQVSLQVSLNDAGKANGFARIFVDEKLYVETQNVEFRGEDAAHTLIQRFLFSTFHGGNTPDWAPVDENGKPIIVLAFFDDIVVVQGIVSDY